MMGGPMARGVIVGWYFLWKMDVITINKFLLLAVVAVFPDGCLRSGATAMVRAQGAGRSSRASNNAAHMQVTGGREGIVPV